MVIAIKKIEVSFTLPVPGGYGWIARGPGGPWVIEDPGLALEATQKVEQHGVFPCATELPRLETL